VAQPAAARRRSAQAKTGFDSERRRTTRLCTGSRTFLR
jgi:hypothetical protein